MISLPNNSVYKHKLWRVILENELTTRIETMRLMEEKRVLDKEKKRIEDEEVDKLTDEFKAQENLRLFDNPSKVQFKDKHKKL